jgi:hypothetical protein
MKQRNKSLRCLYRGVGDSWWTSTGERGPFILGSRSVAPHRVEMCGFVGEKRCLWVGDETPKLVTEHHPRDGSWRFRVGEGIVVGLGVDIKPSEPRDH